MQRRITGAEIVWETLAQEGVEVVFGFPGAQNLPIYDAMCKYPEIHHVLVRHEQGASHAADGYARVSGKVGVAMATSGPGATNLITGITNAMMDSIPTVFITGQVHSSLIGYDAFQEADVSGITLSITKHNYFITEVSEIQHTIREAFYIARTGRPGPVLIDLTRDAQVALADWEPDDTPIRMPGYRPTIRPLQSDFDRAAAMIKAAKRPVVLAGHGVLMSNAMQELRTFVEKTQTPVAMTLLGLGCFPANHPLNLGLMGMHGEAWVNEAIQDSDLILAFGMRFDDRATGVPKTFAPRADKIHFEIDPSEIDKNIKVDLAMVGDLRHNLTQLQPQIPELDHADWIKHINNSQKVASQRDIQNIPSNGYLRAPHVIKDLWKYTGGNAIMVTDVGQHQMWAAQYYPTNRPNSFVTSGGLGTMGFGLPAAVGAKMARPEDEVWVVVGDGGFQMTQMELQTMAQENIKINIALINNGYLGLVRQHQEFFYDCRYSGTPISSPDFLKIAEAHGLASRRVSDRHEAGEAIEWARQQPVTVLLEFRVKPEDAVYPMVPAGASLDQMIRRPVAGN